MNKQTVKALEKRIKPRRLKNTIVAWKLEGLERYVLRDPDDGGEPSLGMSLQELEEAHPGDTLIIVERREE